MKTGIIALVLTLTACLTLPSLVKNRSVAIAPATPRAAQGGTPTTFYFCYRIINNNAPDPLSRGVQTLLCSPQPINTTSTEKYATYSAQWTQTIVMPPYH
jgi:hypothetical protein